MRLPSRCSPAITMFHSACFDTTSTGIDGGNNGVDSKEPHLSVLEMHLTHLSKHQQPTLNSQYARALHLTGCPSSNTCIQSSTDMDCSSEHGNAALAVCSHACSHMMLKCLWGKHKVLSKTPFKTRLDRAWMRWLCCQEKPRALSSRQHACCPEDNAKIGEAHIASKGAEYEPAPVLVRHARS